MTDAIAYLAGVIAMITFIPQVVRTLRTRRSDDISPTMLVLTLVTNLLYIWYGALLELYPIIIMLGIMSLIVLLQVFLTFKYRSTDA
jgi:MtN3 and saliva related transmembrane protein